MYTVTSHDIMTRQNILHNLAIGIFGIETSNQTIDENLIDMNNTGMVGIYYLVLQNSMVTRNTIRNSNSNYAEGFGILLDYSFNNTISDNIVHNITCAAGYGSGIVLFEYSAYNTILRNTVSLNQIGITFFMGVQNNTVYENDITLNTLGMSTDLSFGTLVLLRGMNRDRPDPYSSNNNTIYHNNFNNTVNAYDNGHNMYNLSYPMGGNYWSDYYGVDVNPSDGIGDTPYIISGGSNADYYPFMDSDGWNR
jgi:parallel beta-helix repeat protein